MHSQSANLHHRGKQILNTYWSHPAKAHQHWSKTLRDMVVTALGLSFYNDYLTSVTLMTIGQFFFSLNSAFLLSFYTILPKLMKICRYFLSNWANSIKKSLFNSYLTPLTLTFDNFSLNIKLCLSLIILQHPAKAHINRSITFWVIEETA